MDMSCHVPLEILRKLPYESRIPENEEEDWELFREDVLELPKFGKWGIPLSNNIIPRYQHSLLDMG